MTDRPMEPGTPWLETLDRVAGLLASYGDHSDDPEENLEVLAGWQALMRFSEGVAVPESKLLEAFSRKMTPLELEAACNTVSPEAWSEALDRLVAAQIRFGERVEQDEVAAFPELEWEALRLFQQLDLWSLGLIGALSLEVPGDLKGSLGKKWRLLDTACVLKLLQDPSRFLDIGDWVLDHAEAFDPELINRDSRLYQTIAPFDAVADAATFGMRNFRATVDGMLAGWKRELAERTAPGGLETEPARPMQFPPTEAPGSRSPWSNLLPGRPRTAIAAAQRGMTPLEQSLRDHLPWLWTSSDGRVCASLHFTESPIPGNGDGVDDAHMTFHTPEGDAIDPPGTRVRLFGLEAPVVAAVVPLSLSALREAASGWDLPWTLEVLAGTTWNRWRMVQPVKEG